MNICFYIILFLPFHFVSISHKWMFSNKVNKMKVFFPFLIVNITYILENHTLITLLLWKEKHFSNCVFFFDFNVSPIFSTQSRRCWWERIYFCLILGLNLPKESHWEMKSADLTAWSLIHYNILKLINFRNLMELLYFKLIGTITATYHNISAIVFIWEDFD